MRIQYFSDLHLEFGECAFVDAGADVVVAAGDIDLGLGGVQWLERIGRPVVYVPGNHEFYGADLEAVLAALGESCARSRHVHLLDCAQTVIEGVRFLGATLWTDLAGGALASLAAELMNDYQQIRYRGRLLRPADTMALHAAARDWLDAALGDDFPGPTVVVTHHAPSLQSWGFDPHSAFRHAYCSDLDELIGRHRPALWLHGHVHAPARYAIDAVPVRCNPRGYVGYQPVPGFDITATERV